ncbi:unnamed protein product [Heligmosomoides polygyrus]|uniref:MSP domain-containing protein n=1 Tax=Heligmosomoides polygyrus TaxID=6339 RepID=A0A183GBV5_HELPZ|nr:unnamed protein product [Heligmosomoides polygyrus]
MKKGTQRCARYINVASEEVYAKGLYRVSRQHPENSMSLPPNAAIVVEAAAQTSCRIAAGRKGPRGLP